MAAKLCDKTSQVMATEIIKLFHCIPKKYRKTLTLGIEKECADFLRIKLITGLDIYFSEPYAPWERGTNENIMACQDSIFPKEAI